MGQRPSRDAFAPAKAGPARIGQQGTWKKRDPVTRAPTVGSARQSVAMIPTNPRLSTYDAIGEDDEMNEEYLVDSRKPSSLPSHLDGSIELTRLDVQAFADLPLRVCDPPKAALHPDKNRWSNVYPHYINQVLLKPSDFTYINASWVRSYSADKATEYIATETPSLSSTRAFVHMIWNHKVHFIVLLSDIGMPHGQRYWPEAINHVIEYEGVSVQLQTSEQLSGFLRNTLLFKCGGETREVSLYWYKDWPAMSAPAAPDGSISPRLLVEMMLTVRADRNKFDRRLSPLLVHCDDGISRTGAYIVLDQALDCIEVREKVDVVSLISRAREDRMSLVNTTALFRFVHEAALQYAFYFLSIHPEAPGMVYMEYNKKMVERDFTPRFIKHTLETGQVVLVLRTTEGPPAARTAADRTMFAPTLFTEDEAGEALDVHAMTGDEALPLEMQPFFKSNYSRSQVEDLLKRAAEASFVVSTSPLRPGVLLLSCKITGRVFHTVMERHTDDDGRDAFIIDEDDVTFSTMLDAAAWLISQVQNQHDSANMTTTHIHHHYSDMQFQTNNFHELEYDDTEA
eukprot:m.193332 g.193332  ORF g.193332 m.193332 type:complete len:569 (-) comp16779_c8_seq2:1792-3498(-)